MNQPLFESLNGLDIRYGDPFKLVLRYAVFLAKLLVKQLGTGSFVLGRYLDFTRDFFQIGKGFDIRIFPRINEPPHAA